MSIEERWSDPAFLSQMGETLNSLFQLKKPPQNLDLRGIIVNLDGAPPSLCYVGFADLALEKADASGGRFSCPFANARISETSFNRTFFDTCWLQKAQFRRCTFDQACLDSCMFNDALFTDCSFVDAKVKGRGFNEYGGRRAVFERCNFTGTLFQNLQLRACSFRDCVFEKAIFKKCIAVGLKFEGSSPAETSFVSCQR
jgi:uncharacterized protein YjbI with pentapeptide repeats